MVVALLVIKHDVGYLQPVCNGVCAVIPIFHTVKNIYLLCREQNITKQMISAWYMMLNDVVNILFYSQQLAASAILDNYRRKVFASSTSFYFLLVLQVTFSRSTFTFT